MFEAEPLPAGGPLAVLLADIRQGRLTAPPGLILTPHIAGLTRSQRPRFRHGGVRCDNSPYRRRPMNDSGAPTDEKDMAHIYLDEL